MTDRQTNLLPELVTVADKHGEIEITLAEAHNMACRGFLRPPPYGTSQPWRVQHEWGHGWRINRRRKS